MPSFVVLVLRGTSTFASPPYAKPKYDHRLTQNRNQHILNLSTKLCSFPGLSESEESSPCPVISLACRWGPERKGCNANTDSWTESFWFTLRSFSECSSAVLLRFVIIACKGKFDHKNILTSAMSESGLALCVNKSIHGWISLWTSDFHIDHNVQTSDV